MLSSMYVATHTTAHAKMTMPARRTNASMGRGSSVDSASASIGAARATAARVHEARRKPVICIGEVSARYMLTFVEVQAPRRPMRDADEADKDVRATASRSASCYPRSISAVYPTDNCEVSTWHNPAPTLLPRSPRA